MVQSEKNAAINVDVKLAARLKLGDAAAWQELCLTYAEPLYLVALYRCDGDPATAEDIRQEVLLEAVEAIGYYRGEAPLFAWLCGIVRHKAVDVLRRRKHEIGSYLSTGSGKEAGEDRQDWEALGVKPLPEAMVESGQAQAMLVEALWLLPSEYRRVLLLRYLHGLSVTEVADSLGTSYKAAESLLSRARQALRHHLLEMHYE